MFMTQSTISVDKKKKIIRITVSAVSWAVFIAIVAIFLSVFIQIITKQTPALFGYRFYYVLSDSMSPEIEPGEVIVSKVYNVKKGTPEINVGDVITYIIPEGQKHAGMPNTHKVIEVITLPNGTINLQTSGEKGIDPYTTPLESVQGVMVRKSPFMASIYSLLASKNSIMIIIMIVPPFLTIVSLVYRLVVTIKQKNDEEEKPTPFSEEEYKQKVISDYLKSKDNNQDDGNNT